MKILVAVLNWRNYEDTLIAIQSVKDSTLFADIMLLDNDSCDGSFESLQEHFGKSVIYQANAGNLGFSYGNNPAFLKCLEDNYDFLLLLNNDAKIHPDAIKNAVDYLKNKADVGICGMKLVNMHEPHHIQALGGGYIDYLGVAHHITHEDKLPKITYITGAAALIRAQVIRDIGIMDESYFMYWEDVDYSFRARRAGWKLSVSTDSVVFHKESASSGLRSSRQIAMKNKSALFFAKKFYGPLGHVYYIGMIARALKAQAHRL